MRILKNSTVFIEQDLSYLVISGKLIGKMWDYRPQPVFLYEKGDIICIPPAGMYLRGKSSDATILETDREPSHKDVVKLMTQIITMADKIDVKMDALLEIKERFSLSQWEVSDYGNTWPEYFFKRVREKR